MILFRLPFLFEHKRKPKKMSTVDAQMQDQRREEEEAAEEEQGAQLEPHQDQHHDPTTCIAAEQAQHDDVLGVEENSIEDDDDDHQQQEQEQEEAPTGSTTMHDVIEPDMFQHPKLRQFTSNRAPGIFAQRFTDDANIICHDEVVRSSDNTCLILHVLLNLGPGFKYTAVPVAATTQLRRDSRLFKVFRSVTLPAPLPCGAYRLCVCPFHRRVSAAHCWQDRIVSAADVQDSSSSGGGGGDDDDEVWKVVVEGPGGGEGMMSCMKVERAPQGSCLCNLPQVLRTEVPDVK